MTGFPSGPDIQPLDLPAASRVTQVCSGESNAKVRARWDVSLDGGEAPLGLLALIHAWVACLLLQTQPQVFIAMEV